MMTLKESVQGYNLLMHRDFAAAPDWVIEAAYNGAGPDRWPDWKRRLATGALYLYKPAVVEHDFSYEHSDGTLAGFLASNARFHENMRRIRAAEFSWWLPLANARCVYWWTVAQGAYRAVEEHGWQGYAEQAVKNGFRPEYPPDADLSGMM